MQFEGTGTGCIACIDQLIAHALGYVGHHPRQVIDRRVTITHEKHPYALLRPQRSTTKQYNKYKIDFNVVSLHRSISNLITLVGFVVPVSFSSMQVSPVGLNPHFSITLPEARLSK
jgi:hypothetical protein